MAKTKTNTNTNNIQWFYIYMTTCAPCAKVTPIIDTLIACGQNVSKMELQEFRQAHPSIGVRGTPSIVALNGNNEQIDVIHANIISPLIELGSVAPELITTTIGEYLVNKITK